MKEEELIENHDPGITNEELNDLVPPVESESRYSEDKAALTNRKLNELFKKAQELSHFAMEIDPITERREHLRKGIEKLYAPYRETFKSYVSHSVKQK
ncbi:hypothetical protein AVEN_166729-1 [Araneus ventricosus]|uniref:Uncharacterized protein n=1 Tax=Araneus ventricosus TaxID=182803 RepID=A0A4Y2FZX0_ARAVE|nr:hypothetical protein AVEN_166729-1 [Araneus ventricosus]